ncbi:MAG: zinc ribbon domain-containing protein [Verrucomicrobiota bacterium]
MSQEPSSAGRPPGVPPPLPQPGAAATPRAEGSSRPDAGPPPLSPAPPPSPADAPAPEAVARARFPCASCGAEATWNPAQAALVCSHCGTVAPSQPVAGTQAADVIAEHDLAAALRSIPDERRGWRTARTQVRCQSCTAISVFDPEKIGQRCDFCGSSALVPHEDIKESFTPESLLPLAWAESKVRESVRAWYRSRWFAPSALGTRAMTDTVRAVYIPYWTFDARVHAPWTADSGYYYYEMESYRDAQGNFQTRRVQRVRWVPSAGVVDHFFDDQLVPATRGVHATLLRAVEPFPTRDLVPYDPRFLAGWVVERYQIDLVSAARAARESMTMELRALCAAQVPGDTHRNLSVFPEWSAQTFKHVLVPVWLLTYQYHGRPYQLVINGVTGSIAGERPYSFWKILFLVLAILAVAGVLFYFMEPDRPAYRFRH